MESVAGEEDARPLWGEHHDGQPMRMESMAKGEESGLTPDIASEKYE